jgi:hypothetical protein
MWLAKAVAVIRIVDFAMTEVVIVIKVATTGAHRPASHWFKNQTALPTLPAYCVGILTLETSNGTASALTHLVNFSSWM